MVRSRIWGVIGVVLSIVGVAVIAPEVLHSLGRGHLGPTVLYGAGVLFAALVTTALVGGGVLAES